MSSTYLVVRKVTPNVATAWEPNGGSLERTVCLRDAEGEVNFTSLIENVDGEYIDVAMANVPSDADEITGVSLWANLGGDGDWIDVTMYVDGVSLGTDTVEATVGFDEEELNLSAWDGPWKPWQLDGAYFRIEYVEDKEFGIVLDRVRAEITYTAKTGVAGWRKRADALRFCLEDGVDSTTELLDYDTPSGIVISRPSTRSGEGVGTMRVTNQGTQAQLLIADGGKLLQGSTATIGTGSLLEWRGPQSSTFGVPVIVSADGEYSIEDGEDQSDFVRVMAYTDYLIDTAEDKRIRLERAFAPSLDFNAEDTAAGTPHAPEIWLRNVSVFDVANVKVWIDPGSTRWLKVIEGVDAYVVMISKSQISGFVAPTSEDDPNALAWDALETGGLNKIYVLQFVEAGIHAMPRVPFHLHCSWDRFS
jgi:hypothetical protein